MPPMLVLIISVCLVLAHAWMILCHRQKMGSDPKDKPQDPIYTRYKAYFAFGLMIVAQLLALYRRWHIANGTWQVDSAFHAFLDFLPLPANDFTLILGTAVFCAGFALRIWAIHLLGRLFTFEIGIRAEHKIIEAGPYKFIRHPSYTGYLLMLTGIGIAFASLFAILGQVVPVLIFFYLRMNEEEAMLKQHFGAKYDDYVRRSKRLIPFLY